MDRAAECMKTVFEACFEGELDWQHQDTYLVFLYNYYACMEDSTELIAVLHKISELRLWIEAYWDDGSS